MPSATDRFGAIAPVYDRLNRLLSLGLDVTWRRRALRATAAAHADAPRAILDIATGTADVARAAARRFPSARVTGLDATPAMLAVGRRKLAAAGLSARVTLVEGDAEALPFAPGAFDAALCAFGFRNFTRRRAALAEAARVLSDGGTLTVLEFFRPESRLLGVCTHLWLRAASAAFAPPGEAYRWLRDSIAATCRAAAFADDARAAGFAVLSRRFFFPACTCLILRKCGKLAPSTEPL